jgi:hypothetical protein
VRGTTEWLHIVGKRRHVLTDVHALYFGSERDTRNPLPDPNTRLGTMRFSDWLVNSDFQGWGAESGSVRGFPEALVFYAIGEACGPATGPWR